MIKFKISQYRFNFSMTLLLMAFFYSFTTSVQGQKKILDHQDFDVWNVIKNQSISNNGKFIIYALEKGEKDHLLKIKDANGVLIFDHKRASKGRFTNNSRFALFTIKAWKDSIKELKRRKVKASKIPKDSLGIFDLKKKNIIKIANVKSYKLPKKWSGYMAYLLEETKTTKKNAKKAADNSEKNTTIKKPKKVGKKNGYHLIVRNLDTYKQDTIYYVTQYLFAKKGRRLAYATTGKKGGKDAGVYVVNFDTNISTPVFTANSKASYHQLAFSDSGKRLGFVVDADTTKALIRPNQLFFWKEGAEVAEKLVDATSAPKGYRVSSDGRIRFSKDDRKLYFGLATPPIVKDTTLLKEEIVNVEVWTYNEPRLYTVQELQVKNDKKKSYETVIHLNSKKLVQIASTKYPKAQLADEGNSSIALVSNPAPYQLESQWSGSWDSDYAIVHTTTGASQLAIKKIGGTVRLSPKGKFAYGYSSVDSTWFAYNIAAQKRVDLTKGKMFYNELNDSPRHPGSYGVAGWTKNDEALLIYDRYDIWKFNPNTAKSIRLTNGRAEKVVYRYVKLDTEARYIDTRNKWLLTTFNEENKHAGYYSYNFMNNKGKQLLTGPYSYSKPVMAQKGKNLLFTRQSFEEFPDLRVAGLNFKKQTRISHANPQQKDYNWGSAELVNWISLDGKALTGMLIKPENFDPKKKYPMLVNFYEKSSNRLFRHRAPSAGRSSINYSFYASRGYLIFNPDVYYKIGYPGESAYNCVIPGITSLIEKGFVDKENIGAQGHSWGGYQIAYLVTKTAIFKAAESGAPVPNMISAYGGIRWWTGLSRQFQYEHTQSRIGGTPWEYPSRYIENSPIFHIDKINTPLLIMHNDADGHVPWYQGIEFFVSLRRLGKPSWFLNYNEEPHWPLKLQNRKDFNIRMAQFFDYYLKGAAKPVWMHRGVPAIEKGIHQGYELMPNNK
ncbi:MAG: prolyl oligopeptidase family serine peptidase [Polaribacter sp.]|nr:prolyl oligopeptidase family serine peptidase [Polaribacter sp.]